MKRDNSLCTEFESYSDDVDWIDYRIIELQVMHNGCDSAMSERLILCCAAKNKKYKEEYEQYLINLERFPEEGEINHCYTCDVSWPVTIEQPNCPMCDLIKIKRYMDVEINRDYEVKLKKVYNGIGLVSDSGEKFNICMRDSGFEFNYNNVLYSAKNGFIEFLKKEQV